MTNTHITIGGHKVSSGAKFVKLWENPNPSVDFAPQSITFPNAGDYDKLLFEFKGHKSYSNKCGFSQITDISLVSYASISWSFPYTSGGTVYLDMFARCFSIPSVGTVSFADGGVLSTRTNVTSVAIDNSRMIPLAIYGIKF